MQKLYLDVLYLLSCAANSKKAEKSKIDNMDLDALYSLCKEHSITALVSSVLTEHLKEKPEQYARWSQEQMKALYRDMNFEGERRNILAFLEENGIWYMPLKGVVLKNYYPKPFLREFADNDILFDEKYQTQVEEFMLSRGYKRKQSDSGHVMEYEKEPCFNFEMHRSLYHTNNPVFYDYYKDIKQKLIKDSGNDFGFHFSDEDFYVFMISHAFKHYRDNGVGIRSLLDIYICNKALGEKLDYAYTERELQKIETADFEKQMRALARKAFGEKKPTFSEEDEKILMYYFRSGTYGTQEQKAINQMEKATGKADFSSKGRAKYWFKRVFSLEQYKQAYPRAYKTVVLIPFLILFRMFRGLTKRDALKNENEKLKRLDKR